MSLYSLCTFYFTPSCLSANLLINSHEALSLSFLFILAFLPSYLQYPLLCAIPVTSYLSLYQWDICHYLQPFMLFSSKASSLAALHSLHPSYSGTNESWLRFKMKLCKVLTHIWTKRGQQVQQSKYLGGLLQQIFPDLFKNLQMYDSLNGSCREILQKCQS